MSLALLGLVTYYEVCRQESSTHSFDDGIYMNNIYIPQTMSKHRNRIHNNNYYDACTGTNPFSYTWDIQ